MFNKQTDSTLTRTVLKIQSIYMESSFLISSRFFPLISPKHWYKVVMASFRFTIHSTRGKGSSFSIGTRTQDGPAPLFTLTLVTFSPSLIRSRGCRLVSLIWGSLETSPAPRFSSFDFGTSSFCWFRFAFWLFDSATLAWKTQNLPHGLI